MFEGECSNEIENENENEIEQNTTDSTTSQGEGEMSLSDTKQDFSTESDQNDD
jgi:hypothetical protein